MARATAIRKTTAVIANATWPARGSQAGSAMGAAAARGGAAAGRVVARAARRRSARDTTAVHTRRPSGAPDGNIPRHDRASRVGARRRGCYGRTVRDLFTPLVAAWFVERFGTPTPAQEQGWPAIAAGYD